MTYREICTINRDNLPPSTAPDHKIAYLDIGSIPQLGVIAEDLEELNFGNAPSRARRIVRHDDVVVSTVRPYLQAFARIEDPPESLVASTGFAVLTPNGRVRSDFLFQTVCSHAFLAQLKARMVGSNYPAVNMADIAETTVLLPPIPEQRRIATILSSVDDAIAATRKVIEQTRRVKQGLLQTLMTRGIGHTQFKKTEIGLMPEAWEVASIGALASVKGGKRMPKGRPFAEYPTPHPYIRVSDFADGTVREADLQYVLPEDQKEIARYTIGAGDIYISIAGTIGLVGLVPEHLHGAQLTENAARITVRGEGVTPTWVAAALESPSGQRQIDYEKGVGGGVPKLALFRIKRILIPVPPRAEQEQILGILGTCSSSMRAQAARLDQIERLKRGLMQDLLTGRVRVQPD